MTISNPEETGDPKVFGNWLVTGTNAAGYVVGNGSGLTNLIPACILATNTPVNGYALRYTNGSFYWAP
jgi:hypothetical protein